MIFSVILLVSCLLFVFSNPIFYTSSLLIVSLSLMMLMLSNNLMSVLVILLVIIVYVGAMMILIGYICAVCPNFYLSSISVSMTAIVSFYFFVLIFTMMSYKESDLLMNPPKSDMLSDFLFSSWGVSAFMLLALMLFFTLLMVTSQYVSPQGPFRSTS